MNDDAKLTLAGDAAALLEQMGFTAVGRRKQGAVWLELWRAGVAMRYELPDVHVSAQALAAACAREFSLRVGDEGDAPDGSGDGEGDGGPPRGQA